MRRLIKTGAAGGLGYLGGLLLEKGIETVTGLDFVDGVLEVGGAVLSVLYVNRDMVEAIADNIRTMFGKDPLEITEKEWNLFKKKYNKSAFYLERALMEK